MSVDGSGVRFQNPREVIESRLPDLLIGERGVETTTTSSLRFWYIGTMFPWTTFNQDVSDFYNSGVLHDALERCQREGTALDLESMCKKWPNFASLEHSRTAEERDLQGRFMHSAMDHVDAVIGTLFRRTNGTEAELKALEKVLPKESNFGGAKNVPIHNRKSNEPDILVNMSGEPRIVGELKYSVTCDIPGAIGDPTKMQSQAKHSFRNIIGQALRDMRELGLRFGFVSTYDYTVFLKVVFPKEGLPGVYYSDPVSHKATVISIYDEIKNTTTVTQISTRLGILFLYHRAMNRDHAKWPIEPSQVLASKWFRAKPSNDQGAETGLYNTPHTKHLTPRKQADPGQSSDDDSSSEYVSFDMTSVVTALPNLATKSTLSDIKVIIDHQPLTSERSYLGPRTKRSGTSARLAHLQPTHTSKGEGGSGRTTRSMTQNPKRNDEPEDFE